MRHQNILVASHGTPGAVAAESFALDLCAVGGTLYHLLVVPDLWQGMMGDDWLNNARTRVAFGEYLEGELSREVAEHQARISQAAATRGLAYRPELRQGDPAECVIAYAREIDCELLVVGAPRPKDTPGLRSRLRLETLVRALTVPLIVAPTPHA